MHVVKLEAYTVAFLDGDIVHTHFKDSHLVQPEEVQAMFDVIEQERNGRKALLMVSVGEGTTMTGEARAHASSEASCRYLPVDNRQLPEQCFGFGKMAGRLRQIPVRGRKAAGKCGQHLVAQEIAGQRSIGIAFVVDPFELPGPGVGLDFIARHAEQGAQDAQPPLLSICRDRRRPRYPSAAQQVEQQGFRLVALVMPEQQRVGGDGRKGSIAGDTCRRFKAVSAVPFNVDMLDVACDTEAPSIVGTERGPASGIRRQALGQAVVAEFAILP